MKKLEFVTGVSLGLSQGIGLVLISVAKISAFGIDIGVMIQAGAVTLAVTGSAHIIAVTILVIRLGHTRHPYESGSCG